ncbi:MAG: hypothetical protein V2J55_02815 [Candidatus Competibacteraceae bacterium]|jgi:hypothetical protein|nr:hypothetical protein [Candidatus Competibacteraceae bacterium]
MKRIMLLSLLSLFSFHAHSAINEAIVLMVEEPLNDSVYSGVSNVRGFATGPIEIKRVELDVDGQFITEAPLGGRRADVGAAFPEFPSADQSGFSLAFNYSNLTIGGHTMTLRAVDVNDDTKEATVMFTVTRFENAFIADPASVSVAEAMLSSDGTSIFIDDVLAEGQRYDLRLDWRTASQDYDITQIVRRDDNGGGPTPDITPGLWRGDGVCFNVSADGLKLTAEGSQCDDGSALDIDIENPAGADCDVEVNTQEDIPLQEQGDLVVFSYTDLSPNRDVESATGTFESATSALGVAVEIDGLTPCTANWTAMPSP